MNSLWVASIVEGDGEVEALPVLLRRIGETFCNGSWIRSYPPILQSRSRLVNLTSITLQSSIELAVRQLHRAPHDAAKLILVLFDADDDMPCELGPAITQRCLQIRRDFRIVCVLPNPEFETWFVAAADALRDFLEIQPDEVLPVDPEVQRSKKRWIQDRFRPGKYDPRIDQKRLASRMDLHLCRSRSPSFDKLCRELELALGNPDKETESALSS